MKIMKKRILSIVVVILSLNLLLGCTSTIKSNPETEEELSVKNKKKKPIILSDIEKKIANNELKATDVLKIFDVKRNKNFGNSVPLEKINKIKEFKVDIERLQGRLILHNRFQPDPYHQTEENLEAFKAELLDKNVIKDFRNLSKLNQSIYLDRSLERGKERVIGYYDEKEKSFVDMNNALVDFYDSYLKDSDSKKEGIKYTVLEMVHDNYLSNLLYTRLELYCEENYVKPKEKGDSSVKGMGKVEFYRLSEDYLELPILVEHMEEAVMGGW